MIEFAKPNLQSQKQVINTSLSMFSCYYDNNVFYQISFESFLITAEWWITTSQLFLHEHHCQQHHVLSTPMVTVKKMNIGVSTNISGTRLHNHHHHHEHHPHHEHHCVHCFIVVSLVMLQCWETHDPCPVSFQCWETNDPCPVLFQCWETNDPCPVLFQCLLLQFSIRSRPGVTFHLSPSISATADWLL